MKMSPSIFILFNTVHYPFRKKAKQENARASTPSKVLPFILFHFWETRLIIEYVGYNKIIHCRMNTPNPYEGNRDNILC
jgi:hypothetical protein